MTIPTLRPSAGRILMPWAAFSCSLLVAALAATLAPAATYTWTNGSGNATWDTTLLNWTLGAGNVAWVNSNDAVFGSTGVGTVMVSGTQTITSATFTASGYTITGGQLTLGSATTSISVSTGTSTIASIISGTNRLDKRGSGTLSLTGSNSYNGGTTVSEGTLLVGNTNALGSGTARLAVNGGSLNLNGYSVSVGPLSGSSGAVITTSAATGTTTLATSVGSGNNVTYAGTITDNGSGVVALTKTGGATLTLSASNSYSGGTTMSGNGGGLVLGHNSSLGTGLVQIRFPSVIQASAPLSGVANNILWWDFATGLTFSGSNSMTFTGTLTQQGNDRTLTNNLSSGNTLTLGDVRLAGTDTVARTMTVSGTGNTTFAGVIANGTNSNAIGSLTITNTGTTTLSGVNTFTGNIVASGSGGRLRIGGAGRLAGTSGTYAGTITGTNVTFEYASSANSVLSGVISGTIPLVQSGLGTLALSGANTFAGGVTLAGGQLTVGNASALGVGSITITGGSLDTDASRTLSTNNAQNWNGDFTFVGSNALNLGTGPITLGSNRTVTVTSNTLTVGGVIDDGVNTYGLTKAGAGTLVLGNANTFHGATTVTAGTLVIGVANAISGSSAITVGSAASRGALLVSQDLTVSSLTFDGLGGELSNGGNGIVTLANATTGTATISALSGTSQFHNDAVFGTATVVNVASGALFSFHNNLSGSASLTKAGLGTLELVGDNDPFSGSFFITAGRVNIGGGMNQIGTGTTTLSAGATLDLGGQAFTDRIISNGGTILNAGGTATTTTIAGPTTFSGTTTLLGTYNITSSGSARFDSTVGNGSSIVNVNVNSGAGSGGQAFFAGVVSGSANVTVNVGGTATFGNTMSGYVISHGESTFNGSVLSEVQVKTGGAATFSGSTGALSVVSVENGGRAEFSGTVAGTLGVSGSARFTNTSTVAKSFSTGSSGVVTLDNIAGYTATDSLRNDGSLVVIRSSGSQTIASAITGGGTLTKRGAGTLVLTGNNTFSGLTTVESGVLSVNGQLMGAGGATVQAGATLGGSGVIAGNLGGNGLIGPGNSPGILTVQGQLVPTGSTAFAFEFSGTGAPTWSNAEASFNDVLRLTGTSPFANTLTDTNVVNIYFEVASLTNGDAFLGGFFVDNSNGVANLLTTGLGSATFQYFVRGDGQGSNPYNNKSYYTLDQYLAANSGLGITGVSRSVVNVSSAYFSGGTITTGQVTQFVIVPEPGTLCLTAMGLAAAGVAFRRRRR